MTGSVEAPPTDRCRGEAEAQWTTKATDRHHVYSTVMVEDRPPLLLVVFLVLTAMVAISGLAQPVALDMQVSDHRFQDLRQF